MKILIPGREQQGWSKEFECTGRGNGGGGCGAMLLVEQDDLYFTESHARDETDRYTTFCCAQCGVETDLLEKDKPHSSIPIPSKKAWLDKHRRRPNLSAELWGENP